MLAIQRTDVRARPDAIERRLRVEATLLAPELRADFRFALYERERQILHGARYSLRWNGGNVFLV